MQMLEQVGEAGAAGRLVLGADIVPDADRDHRGLAVGVDDDAQAVGEREGLERDVDPLDQGRDRIGGAAAAGALFGAGGGSGGGGGGRDQRDPRGERESRKQIAHVIPHVVQAADTSAVYGICNTVATAPLRKNPRGGALVGLRRNTDIPGNRRGA